MVRLIFLLLLTSQLLVSGKESPERAYFNSETVLKKEAANGAYAIPKIVSTKQDTILIVFQDRQGGDWGSSIAPLGMRSTDKGKTWSKPFSLVPEDFFDFSRFHVKPTGIVVDRIKGKIHVFISRSPLVNRKGETILERWFYTNIQETRELGRAWFQVSSSDDGKTWTKPREITEQLIVKAHWQEWSPVHTGFQIESGPHQGRMVVPVRCYCPETDPSIHDLKYQFNGLIYSDDGGDTWIPGGKSESSVGECSIAERSDGTIYMNHRTSAIETRNPERLQNLSFDGGDTFTAMEPSGLQDARCHAGLIAMSDSNGERVFLLSNVPGPGRKELTINLSIDEGRSWQPKRVIEHGPTAYSDLAVLSDGTIVCVFETGEKSSRKDLAIARFNLEWVNSEPL